MTITGVEREMPLVVRQASYGSQGAADKQKHRQQESMGLMDRGDE